MERNNEQYDYFARNDYWSDTALPVQSFPQWAATPCVPLLNQQFATHASTFEDVVNLASTPVCGNIFAPYSFAPTCTIITPHSSLDSPPSPPSPASSVSNSARYEGVAARIPVNRRTGSDRPFKCEECPQSFNRPHDLKRHRRIHLTVKPFPCGYCDKRFARKDALKRHHQVRNCMERMKELHERELLLLHQQQIATDQNGWGQVYFVHPSTNLNSETVNVCVSPDSLPAPPLQSVLFPFNVIQH